MSKAIARSVDYAGDEESIGEHDETASLPALPGAPMAHDESADNLTRMLAHTIDENLQRLIELSESMNRHLESIAAAMADSQPRRRRHSRGRNRASGKR